MRNVNDTDRKFYKLDVVDKFPKPPLALVYVWKHFFCTDGSALRILYAFWCFSDFDVDNEHCGCEM